MTTRDDATERPELEVLLDLLDDQYARDILTATSRKPMSVKEISAVSAAAPSTLYRRVERLRDARLLAERTRIRADGHHDTTYVATLRRLQVTLADGQLDFTIERTDEDAADRLWRLWREF